MKQWDFNIDIHIKLLSEPDTLLSHPNTALNIFLNFLISQKTTKEKEENQKPEEHHITTGL